jgi:hypothetical protein
MDLPAWLTDMSLYHYLAIGGGVLVVLALVLYFTPVSRLKIPGIFFGIVGGLGMGAALGVLAMAFYGYQLKQPESTGGASPQSGMGPGGGPPNMMAMMGRGGMPNGGGSPGRMGGGRPNSKTQLASLVAKLDVLTNEPLAVKLNPEQKKKMREQLQMLDEQENLSEDEAKAKLDALLDILKDQRQTLEAAGYRWPGQGGGRGRGGQPASALANPFKDEQNSKHLKALQSQLDKKIAN